MPNTPMCAVSKREGETPFFEKTIKFRPYIKKAVHHVTNLSAQNGAEDITSVKGRTGCQTRKSGGRQA